MARRGRRPKPTNLKILQGTLEPSRANPREPKPDPSIPMPPPHLCDEAKVEWGRVSTRLYALGCLSDIDRAALAAYCQAYGKWVQVENVIREMFAGGRNPMMTRNPAATLIPNPLSNVVATQRPAADLEASEARDGRADMLSSSCEFCMTPRIRSALSVTPPALSKSADKYFNPDGRKS